jgi:hypothetical protein
VCSRFVWIKKTQLLRLLLPDQDRSRWYSLKEEKLKKVVLKAAAVDPKQSEDAQVRFFFFQLFRLYFYPSTLTKDEKRRWEEEVKRKKKESRMVLRAARRWIFLEAKEFIRLTLIVTISKRQQRLTTWQNPKGKSEGAVGSLVGAAMPLLQTVCELSEVRDKEDRAARAALIGRSMTIGEVRGFFGYHSLQV